MFDRRSDGAPGQHRDGLICPTLPPGYHAQAAWGFRDRTGRLRYEFNRVYGPPAPLDKRRPICPICQLDQNLSYWSVTWPSGDGDDDAPMAGRWLSFAEAVERSGPRLTFARFSSLTHLRDEQQGPPHGGDVRLEPRPTVSLSSA